MSHQEVTTQDSSDPQNGGANLGRLFERGLAAWHGGKPHGARILLRARGKPVSVIVLEDRE